MTGSQALFEGATLESIERRRSELLTTTFTLVISLSIGMVLLSFAGVSSSWLRDWGGTVNAIRVSLVVLCVGFSVYVIEKERQLRTLARDVFNERVMATALSHRMNEVSLLAEAGKSLLLSLEQDDPLMGVLEAATELSRADEGSIMLVEGKDLRLAAATGHQGVFKGHSRPLLEAGFPGYVVRKREPVLVEDDVDVIELSRDPWWGIVVSGMFVPLVAGDEMVGVLHLSLTVGERRFSEYDLRSLALFCELAAVAIRHSRPLRRAREIYARLSVLEDEEGIA